jgi:hypothetical protein
MTRPPPKCGSTFLSNRSMLGCRVKSAGRRHGAFLQPSHVEFV